MTKRKSISFGSLERSFCDLYIKTSRKVRKYYQDFFVKSENLRSAYQNSTFLVLNFEFLRTLWNDFSLFYLGVNFRIKRSKHKRMTCYFQFLLPYYDFAWHKNVAQNLCCKVDWHGWRNRHFLLNEPKASILVP